MPRVFTSGTAELSPSARAWKSAVMRRRLCREEPTKPTAAIGVEMAQQVRGVIAAKKGAPVTGQTVVGPDPGPGEALLRVQACGVCRTDLHCENRGINDDFPFLLG